MAAFDRRIWNLREKPASRDWNTFLTNSDFTTREMVKTSLAYRTYIDSADGQTPFGFAGQSFRVTGGPGMTVNVLAGIGFQDGSSDVPTDINGAQGLDDLSPLKPLVLTTDETINSIPAADPSDPRIDIVEVQYDRQTTDNSSRLVLNTGTGQFDPQSVDKTLSAVLDGNTSINGSAKINYKTGTPNSSPVVPTTTTGYIKLCQIKVPALASAITDSMILDLRRVIATPQPGTVNIRCTIDTTSSTWTLASSILDPVCIAAPGLNFAVFTRKHTSGGFTGLNSVGVVAWGASLPALARSGASHLPLGPQSVQVYLADGTVTTSADILQPLHWSPYFQTQTNTLDLTTDITSTYGTLPDDPSTDWSISDPMNVMQTEGFPMRFSSSTKTYSQSGISGQYPTLVVAFSLTVPIV